jgi:ferredoxin
VRTAIISENFRANPSIDHKDDRKNHGMKGAQGLPALSPAGRGSARQVLIRCSTLLVARIALLYDRLAGRHSVGNERRKRRINRMKVVVDEKLCEGNTKCQQTAPEVFEVRDDDKSHLLIDSPPERMREKIKLAVRLCPRQAITVSDD